MLAWQPTAASLHFPFLFFPYSISVRIGNQEHSLFRLKRVFHRSLLSSHPRILSSTALEFVTEDKIKINT